MTDQERKDWEKLYRALLSMSAALETILKK